MTSVCFYFQLHQPFRLKPFSFFKIGNDHQYEALALNVEILNRVSDRCYLPANALIYRMIHEHGGKFKVAFSVSGTCLEQLERHRPDVISSFKKLAETGCVEFLAETYYHSLASLYSPAEFQRQVKMHEKKITQLFGLKPKVFRNTELIYQNGLEAQVADLGFKMILAEGAPKNLGRQHANKVFEGQGGKLKMLLRNYVLSDDIAFRFSDPTWSEYPLMADTFASWLHRLGPEAETVNLFLDYETFGEHRKEQTGIFDFMYHLPKQVLKSKDFGFALPSDLLKSKKEGSPYESPAWTSWADEDKDVSAWTEDHMQKDALLKVYALEERLTELKKPDLFDQWGKLQTSDHFYYMSTRYQNDATHQAFSPYDSPYDAYLNYMNVLSDFRKLIGLS